MDGILLITLAFWCKREKDFILFWEALRYLTISMLFAAFCWKVFITRSFFNSEQAEAIVKNNLALYLFQNPNSLFSNFMYFILQHKFILQLGFCVTVFLQGAMLVGYFTKKYDKVLFWFPIVFHLTTYFFVDVFFFELWVLNFTFITEARLNKLIFKIKSLIPVPQYAKKNYSKGI